MHTTRTPHPTHAPAARVVKRRVTSIVLRVRVRLLGEQLAHNLLRRRGLRRVVQRAQAAERLGLNVRVLAQQQRHDRAARVARSPRQRVARQLVLCAQRLGVLVQQRTQVLRVAHRSCAWGLEPRTRDIDGGQWGSGRVGRGHGQTNTLRSQEKKGKRRKEKEEGACTAVAVHYYTLLV